MLEEHQLVPAHCSPLPVARGPWLVCAPHADDESFGMGGTLALAADAGIQTHLVVMTDGALGGTQSNLVDVREQEARAAAAVLGIASVYFLGQPDRGLEATPRLVATLNELLDILRPGAVFFPGVHELHPDHRRCALLLWETLQKRADPALTAVAFEITMQSPTNCLVDITPAIARKQAALAVYQSQLVQNAYLDLVLALNRLRTFTLPRDVQYAEAFYCFSADELALSLQQWTQQQASRLLE